MIGRSLVTRLTLLQQLMAVLMIASFGTSALWMANRSLRDEDARVLVAMARRVAAGVDSELSEEGNLAHLAAAAIQEESPGKFRIDVYDSLGELLASTEPKVARGPMDGPLADGDLGDRGGRYRAALRSASGALVVASVSDQDRIAQIAALRRGLLWSAAPLLVVTLLVGRWTSRRALRPLVDMGDRARGASVDAGVRSLGDATGVEEVDRLGDSFNRLLARLDDLLNAERRFTSNASHELRTPLTVLSGELETTLDSPLLPPEVRGGLLRASEQVRVMRELVEALLLLRRAGEGASRAPVGFEPVNLSDLATDAVRRASAEHPTRVADIFLACPDEVMVSGQPALLAAAIRNLADNAIKFTSPGRKVKIAVRADDSQADVIVDDGGEGVPTEERDRIFEPFYRGPEARAALAGLGLGLPLLRQVARAHGGNVTVGKSPLGGARFTLSLPLWRSLPESGTRGALTASRNFPGS